jgi:TetR/AcrR family transcriptional regulator, cholesterol catabolism regulator
MDIRERIIEEAGKLFIEKGIKVVTMDSIAQSLGISKRTIYENFKDKNDLLRNFLISSALYHKNKLLDILKKSVNVIEALFAFGEFNRNAFSAINPVFFDDLKKYHSKLYSGVVNDEHIRNHEISFTILKRGVNEGVFVKTINIEIANLFIHNTMEFFHNLDKTFCYNHEDIWQSVFFPYLKGICTDKGLELMSTFVNKYENFNN